MAESHKIVPHDEWIEERKKLLAKEKEFNRLRDQLSEQRRALPWERVEKQYTFEGPNGKETLAQLFDGASQLVVYHFMFDPKWDAGCPRCSFWADNFDRIPIHLKHRDISFVAISRAPHVEHRLRGNHVRDVVDHDGRDDDSERDADHSWNHGQHERNGARRVLHDRLSHRMDRIQRRCDGGAVGVRFGASVVGLDGDSQRSTRGSYHRRRRPLPVVAPETELLAALLLVKKSFRR
jgi:hypothetical protein